MEGVHAGRVSAKWVYAIVSEISVRIRLQQASLSTSLLGARSLRVVDAATRSLRL